MFVLNNSGVLLVDRLLDNIKKATTDGLEVLTAYIGCRCLKTIL